MSLEYSDIYNINTADRSALLVSVCKSCDFLSLMLEFLVVPNPR